MLDTTKFDAHVVAKTLWNEGFAFYNFDERLVVLARDHLQTFLQRRIDRGDNAAWSFTRPGEEQDLPDLGLSQFDGTEDDPLSGNKKDCKARLHDDCSLRQRLDERGVILCDLDLEFLRHNAILLEAVNQKAYQIALALDELYGLNCANEVLYCQRHVSPFGTTLMRSLFYAALRIISGAQSHIDRSWNTNHLGDLGGVLEAKLSGRWENISPPAGKAVSFFGVKSLWVTRGKKRPLLHRSTTRPGEERFANVHFSHVRLPCGYQVTSPKKAVQHFQANVLPAIQAGTY
jgi:hypothetical protein